MKILLKIAALAAVEALAAGCCSCRSYQKKNRRPLVGTEWQLIQLGGKAVKPEEGKFTLTFLAEENRINMKASGFVVYLNVPPHTLLERTRNDRNRPLLQASPPT